MKMITYKKLLQDTDKLVELVKQNVGHDGNSIYTSVYGVPRGGVAIALLVAKALSLPMIDKVEDIEPFTLIVDDLVDSGKTRKKHWEHDFAVLYKKPHSPEPTYFVEEIDGWIEFVFEDTQTDERDIIVRLLETLGEDPTREGLVDTPKRVLKFYEEFLHPPEFNFTTFENEGTDQMIVQKNIPFFSLCEHHMAPFFGTATVAYIPAKRIVGISKLARTVQHYANRLQNQERITTQIAERLEKELQPLGVAVSISGRHFCMEMRGVKTLGASTTTTKLIGAFKDEPETRAEFFASAKEK